MSNLKKSKFAASRSIGHSIHDNPKDAVKKRAFFPGQHGHTVIRKNDNYSTAKKMIKFVLEFYGIKFYQLKKYYILAKSKKGDPIDNLFSLLNCRLATCAFLANFGRTFYAANQLISHGHILINGKKVDRKSYRLKENDIVSLSKNAILLENTQVAIQTQTYKVPDFIKLSEDKTSFTILRSSTFKDIAYSFDINPTSIIEYLSR